MATVLCLDFDDTIVLDNTARQLFMKYAEPGWREVDARSKAGHITIEQYNAQALDLFDPTLRREEIEEYVLSVARPREGVGELYDYALDQGWQVAIVSLGFDLYVDPVLDRLGFERAARHMGRTSNDYRWRVRFLSPRGVEVEDGFKVAYARAFRDAGDFVIYAGDGKSDIPAARLAGAVFARSTLWDVLEHEHPRIAHFETFHDILAGIERDAGQWPLE